MVIFIIVSTLIYNSDCPNIDNIMKECYNQITIKRTAGDKPVDLSATYSYEQGAKA